MTEQSEKDFSKEAVLKRLSAKRRGKEAAGFWPSLILDTLVLLASLYAFWMAAIADLPDDRTVWFAMAFVGSPAAFALSRFIRSRPTPPGWLWLAVSFLAVIAIIVSSLT